MFREPDTSKAACSGNVSGKMPGACPHRDREPARIGEPLYKEGWRPAPTGRAAWTGARIQTGTYRIRGRHRGRPTACRRPARGQPGRGCFSLCRIQGETGAGRPGKSQNGGRNQGWNTGVGALGKGRSGAEKRACRAYGAGGAGLFRGAFIWGFFRPFRINRLIA